MTLGDAKQQKAIKMNNLSEEGTNCTTNSTVSNKLTAKVLFIVQLVHIVLTLILNTAIFTTIANQKKLRRKKSCQFVLNLLIVHSVISTSFLISYLSPSLNIRIYISVGLLMEMVFTLIIITWDRYKEIKTPFYYENISAKHVLLILLCSWILSVTLFCITYILKVSEDRMMVINSTLIVVAITILPPSNASIYYTARKHANIVLKYIMATNPNVNKEIKRFKSTYVCIAMSSSFVLCWLPYFIHDVLVLLNKFRKHEVFTECVERVALLDSLLHPIFFVVLRGDIKKEVKRLLHIVIDLKQEYSFTQSEVKRKVQEIPVECKIVSRKDL